MYEYLTNDLLSDNKKYILRSTYSRHILSPESYKYICKLSTLISSHVPYGELPTFLNNNLHYKNGMMSGNELYHFIFDSLVCNLYPNKIICVLGDTVNGASRHVDGHICKKHLDIASSEWGFCLYRITNNNNNCLSEKDLPYEGTIKIIGG